MSLPDCGPPPAPGACSDGRCHQAGGLSRCVTVSGCSGLAPARTARQGGLGNREERSRSSGRTGEQRGEIKIIWEDWGTDSRGQGHQGGGLSRCVTVLGCSGLASGRTARQGGLGNREERSRSSGRRAISL